jgi:protein transport protein DSL1/ZW10
MKQDEGTNLDLAIIGLKAFKELEKVANQLWKDLDETIVSPRTVLPLDGSVGSLSAITVHQVDSLSFELTCASTDHLQNRLSLSNESTDRTIKSLFIDLEAIIRFLVGNLPFEFIEPLSKSMMPILVQRILDLW